MEKSFKDHLRVLILAGGGGTRLWPKSRHALPKHLIKNLIDRKSLLEIAYSRAGNLAAPKDIYVVTIKDYAGAVAVLLPELPSENIIEEPVRKNTAMAMIYGAYKIGIADPNAVIINLAADHFIKDDKVFRAAVLSAARKAFNSRCLLTVGIVPRYAHTGLGYIRVGKQIDNIEKVPIFKVSGFVEKPDQTTAQAFIASGEYFWNANMYTWRSDALLNTVKKTAAVFYKAIKEIEKGKNMKSVYSQVPDISIDYAISEKAKNLLMVPGNFEWHDVGDWRVVHELSQRTPEGNYFTDPTKVLADDVYASLVEANGRLVAISGIKDLIVVDTPDILMICDRNKAQDVKKLVERLKQQKKIEYL